MGKKRFPHAVGRSLEQFLESGRAIRQLDQDSMARCLGWERSAVLRPAHHFRLGQSWPFTPAIKLDHRIFVVEDERRNLPGAEVKECMVPVVAVENDVELFEAGDPNWVPEYPLPLNFALKFLNVFRDDLFVDPESPGVDEFEAQTAR
jgi:hypothetical protein